MKQLEISGRVLARNSLINFFGQAVPLIVGVITIPFIVRGLGVERFGLLSLAWVVLGYFTIFDLGLGRATTKYVAEALGKGEESKVPQLVWTAVTVQALLGLVGALVLASITPLLTERILNIPSGLLREAKTTFYLLSLAIPIILISSSFSGILEAVQRFDLVNYVKIPSSAFNFLIPLVGWKLGFVLPGIVILIMTVRLIGLIIFIIIDFHFFPRIRGFSTQFLFLKRLLTFGGWVTVSNIVSPILAYFDRFLIGSLLSMAAVTYYTAPYEAVTKLWIIPMSLTMALFPAFSSLNGNRALDKVESFFVRAVKYVFATLGPVVLILVLFSREILGIWLGDDFAVQSSTVFQILGFGILVNSLAHVPYSLLQGIGRPDIPAKFHLLELPFYVGTVLALTNVWGITGTALAWLVRVTIDSFLLFIAAFRVFRFPARLLTGNGVKYAGSFFVLLIFLLYGLKRLRVSLLPTIQPFLFMFIIGLFLWVIWKKVLNSSDRKPIISLMIYLEGSKPSDER
jgi:O-antigen/teichoic acid export membrane protein